MILGVRRLRTRRPVAFHEHRDPLLSLRAFVFLLVSVGVGVILYLAGAPVEAVVSVPISVLLALVVLVGA